MKRNSLLIGILTLILSIKPVLGATRKFRSELNRYILLHDKTQVDRGLKGDLYDDFLSLDLSVSSGLKRLIGEADEATENSQSTIAKTVSILTLLNQNINSEKFVDLDALFSSTLPYIKYKGLRFLPSIFFQINFGVSLSISNLESVTNPKAQVYIKKDTKLGLHSKIRLKKNKFLHFSFYKLDRSDLLESLTSTDIVSKSGLFEFDELQQSHIAYAADI